jgi:hypothetical protein
MLLMKSGHSTTALYNYMVAAPLTIFNLVLFDETVSQTEVDTSVEAMILKMPMTTPLHISHLVMTTHAHMGHSINILFQ